MQSAASSEAFGQPGRAFRPFRQRPCPGQHQVTKYRFSPLCRFCHRLKQAEGWTLTQASPGVMTWTTPAGRRYTTLPSKHPT
jgi:hypothetical protein